jgi:hypothetical protein
MSVVRHLAFLCLVVLALAASLSSARAALLTAKLTADDGFFYYVSTDDNVRGNLVASHNDWTQPLIVNTNLADGTYYLHVVVINSGGLGAFAGEFTFGGITYRTNTTTWRAQYDSTNSAWVKPTGTDSVISLGTYPTYPWNLLNNDISYFSQTTNWIWSSAAQNNCQNGSTCTVSFSAKISNVVAAAVPAPGALALLGLGLFGFGAVRRAKA